MKNLSYWYIDIIKISHEKEVIQVGKKSFIFTLLDLTTFYISLNDSNDICEVFFELSAVRIGRSGC